MIRSSISWSIESGRSGFDNKQQYFPSQDWLLSAFHKAWKVYMYTVYNIYCIILENPTDMCVCIYTSIAKLGITKVVRRGSWGCHRHISESCQNTCLIGKRKPLFVVPIFLRHVHVCSLWYYIYYLVGCYWWLLTFQFILTTTLTLFWPQKNLSFI